MEYKPKTLELTDVSAASTLDKKWFGESGISQEALTSFINQNPNNSIGIFRDGVLLGFATFEVIEPGFLPSDYIGKPLSSRVLFIQQFTTEQNYSGNMEEDESLLTAVERKARELGCSMVVEALDEGHAFSKERSLKERGVQHDAFGFYERHGFTTDMSSKWDWQVEGIDPVICLVYAKKLL